MKENNVEYRKQVSDILVNVRVDIKEFLYKHNWEYINDGNLLTFINYWRKSEEKWYCGEIGRIYIETTEFGIENVYLEMVDADKTKKAFNTCEIWEMCTIADNLNHIAEIEDIKNEDERLDAISKLKHTFYKENKN